MGFNCPKAKATSRRQFTVYHSVPRIPGTPGITGQRQILSKRGLSKKIGQLKFSYALSTSLLSELQRKKLFYIFQEKKRVD